MTTTEIPTPKVILLGTQRSGTTLLTRILSCHSEFFIQNEVSVESTFIQKKKDEILVKINEQIKKRHSKDIQTLLQSENKSLWGFKDPELTYHLDALRDFVPETKFILLIRDARGVVNSYMENKWGLGTNAYTGAIRWENEVNSLEEFASILGSNCLTVKFEELVSHPGSVIASVCEHLDIDFEEEMLSFHKVAPTFKVNDSNKNTNRKLAPSFAEKWSNELTQRQIAEIESVCKTTMARYSYPLITNAAPPSKLRKLYYKIHQKIIGEIQIQYQLKRVILIKALKNWKNDNA